MCRSFAGSWGGGRGRPVKDKGEGTQEEEGQASDLNTGLALRKGRSEWGV